MKRVIRTVLFPVFHWWFGSMFYEICRSGQSSDYRWFRIREMFGFPSYAKSDKEARLKFIQRLSLNRQIS